MAEEAFLDIETLYQRYRLPIFRSVAGVVFDAAAAEDLTQQTFEKAWKVRPSYRGGPDVVRWWLFRIAMKEAMSWLGRQRSARVEDGEPADIALSVLSPKLRAAVVLSYFAELTPQEVAAALDIPRGGVTTRLTEAKRLMRAALATARSGPARLPGGEPDG